MTLWKNSPEGNRKKSVLRVLWAVAVLGLVPFAHAADLSNHKALLISEAGNTSATNDVDDMKNALQNGGWNAANIRKIALAKNAGVQAIKDEMNTTFGTPGTNNHLKLFYYSGHSWIRWADNNPPEEPDGKEEGIVLVGRDDDMKNVWKDYTGNRVVIWDTCYAEGEYDGADDPGPSGAYIYAASRKSESSVSREYALRSHWNGEFTNAILEGLDKNGADSGIPGNGEVTLKELKDYVAAPPRSYTDGVIPQFQAPSGMDNVVIGNVPATQQNQGGAGSGQQKKCEDRVGGWVISPVSSFPAPLLAGILVVGAVGLSIAGSRKR